MLSMAKLIYAAITSLDGYVADADGMNSKSAATLMYSVLAHNSTYLRPMLSFYA